MGILEKATSARPLAQDLVAFCFLSEPNIPEGFCSAEKNHLSSFGIGHCWEQIICKILLIKCRLGVI